ncbi:MAG: DinB family protein [Bacteroidota bacterium]
MNTPLLLAKHLRDIHTGGNWTTTNLKDTLTDVTWEEAGKSLFGLNSIAVLTYHVTYYVDVLLKVLEGGPLDSKDEYSFQLPVIGSQSAWEQLIANALATAEKTADLIEKLPEEQLFDPFTDEKYGNYYRNIAGIIEHMHYHLGQISLLKKLVRNEQIHSAG